MKKLSLILLIIAPLVLVSCSSNKKVTTGNRGTMTQLVPSTDKQVSELIRQARTWIGTPYAYGEHTRKKGTDCSGLIMELYKSVYDVILPRSSAMQHEYSKPVKFGDMKPGDLVFFKTGKNATRVNHVGLYIGNNRMIHASTSRGVMESELGEKYWQNTYHSSGCIINTNSKRKKEAPAKITVPSTPLRDIQKLYDALDEQIDSIYVADPAIFD